MAVVLSLRGHGLKQAKGLFKKLYKKEGDERTELQKALDAWLCSSQPRRLRECKKCQRFFFDRSRRNSGQQCDGCRAESVTEERPVDRLAAKITLTRKLPPADELEQLLSLGHDGSLCPWDAERPVSEAEGGCRPSEPKHTVNDYLVKSCRACGHVPRTFLLTFWWVQSHDNFWKDLVNDLPVTLRDVFNARWRESSKTLTGRRHAALALVWCIREADHCQALSQNPFVQQMENWIVKLQVPTWEFLDLTYLPPYDLSVLQKVSETAHQSSKRRKHASDYWGRGGITRYAGSVTSQGYWTASAGPLAVRLRLHVVDGKIWDEKQPVPRALWKEILKLWSLRYPERKLPSVDALRLRVTQGFFV